MIAPSKPVILPDEMLSAILGSLDSAQPSIETKRLAAVAIILDIRSSPRTLLIKRAERHGDPWSGQVAFPGGKMARGDTSARDTAVRETKEELSLDLSKDSSFLGYYRPFRTHTGEMDVIPAVFQLMRDVRVVPNTEVSEYAWVELTKFLLPRSASTYRFKAGAASMEMPAFVIGDYVVWGLTHRILSSLLGEASA